jgi:hypothetical protein
MPIHDSSAVVVVETFDLVDELYQGFVDLEGENVV